MQRTLEQIALSSQRAAHMVNQLLSMARAEDESQVMRMERIDLAQITMEVVRDFVPRAMDKRIDLGFEAPPDGSAAWMRGQPVLVRELVRNLVDNALQYTPAGGTVTARVLPDPEGRVVALQVEDSGPGIPPDEREMIFRSFYRVLGTEVDGSGLGLAIVLEIVQKHGAKVEVTAANGLAPPLGPGALFTVRFPVQGPI
jgi:two-component system sensor histidine kinase TctE